MTNTKLKFSFEICTKKNTNYNMNFISKKSTYIYVKMYINPMINDMLEHYAIIFSLAVKIL